MPILKVINSRATLRRAIDYTCRKAEQGEILGINCRAEYAAEEMIVTKAYYGKTDGRQYQHYVLSFAPEDNVDAETVLKIATEFVKKQPKFDGHEVLIAMHSDRDHKHAHLIVNTVNTVNGSKLHVTKKEYAAMIKEQQEIALEHGFLPVQKKQHRRGDLVSDNNRKNEAIIRGTQRGKQADIEFVYSKIKEASNLELQDFLSILTQQGIEVVLKDNLKHAVFIYNNRRFRDSNIAATFNDTDVLKENLIYELQRNGQHGNEKGRLEHGIAAGELGVQADEIQADVRELERYSREVEELIHGDHKQIVREKQREQTLEKEHVLERTRT